MNEDRSSEEPRKIGQEEAQAWVVRLASGKLTAEEASTFRQWYARHPEHAVAFAEAKQHWKAMGQAAQEFARTQAVTINRSQGQTALRSRRWVLGAGALAASAAVAAIRPPFELWSPVVDFSADYHTGVGEVQTIAMGEHATVQLSTRSRLALQSDQPSGLRIALLSGEAAIVSGSRPVTAVAGDGEVRAVSSRFNLRNDDGIVRVTCLTGKVDVSCENRELTLQANQQVRYAAQGVTSSTMVDPEEVTAWQRGVLVFRNRSLRYVVDEVNRYRAGKIMLLNRELASRPVALASFHLDRLDEIITQMEALYGAKARHLPGGIVLLS
jgi:transmembrane sensor